MTHNDKVYNKIFAIPDIHGEFNLLVRACQKMVSLDGYNPDTDLIVFLGDYIDRGPDSKSVIDFIKKLVDDNKAIALRGNHESFAIDCYTKGRNDDHYLWMINGGSNTLISYSDNKVLGQNSVMDYEHVKFLGSLPTSFEQQGFFFSHAPVPREKERNGPRGYGDNFMYPGDPYNLWELTWNYFPEEEEDLEYGGMVQHKGPVSQHTGTNLIGVCGHIHRAPLVKTIREFPKYRLLDCGAGCYRGGPLAIHECISNTTTYTYQEEL